MKRAIALLCLGMTACVTPPARVTVNSESRQGLILVEIDPSNTTFSGMGGLPSTVALGYFLTFSEHPKGASADVLPELGDWVHVGNASASEGNNAFLCGAGSRWHLRVGSIECRRGSASWGSCFNKGTIAFDLKAGEVVYLGAFSPRLVFQDIAANLPSGVPGGTFSYVFDRTAPAFTTPPMTAQKTAEITQFLTEMYPKVNAPIKTATTRPVAFQKAHAVALVALSTVRDHWIAHGPSAGRPVEQKQLAVSDRHLTFPPLTRSGGGAYR